MREFAKEAVKLLRAARFDALWAGGCVRDQLLGKTPKDYDVATSATPDQVREVFGRRRTIPVGAAFGVITLIGPPEVGNLDVATFRQDGGYTDGRRPDAVTYGSAELDAQRRDFTINGLFFDPMAEKVIDYVGGEADLKTGILRAIGNAHERFAEDKLRMLRAVRFTAALHFQFDAATRKAVEDYAGEILQVSAERIAAEMRRMLSHATRADAVSLLRDVGLLGAILHEAAAMKNNDWNNMLTALRAYQGNSFSCALAMVLRFSENGATNGAKLAKQLGDRWRLSTEETELTADSLTNERTFIDADKLPWPTVQRKLIHPEAKQIVEYAKAIANATKQSESGLRFCDERLTWPAEKLNPKPLVTGDDLVSLGMKPGKEFKSLLDKIRDLQLDDKITSKEEGLRECGLN